MSVPGNTLKSKVLTVAAVFVVGAGLHLGQSLFVPLAFSILLALILSPLVRLGERMHIPRPVSAVTVVILVFGLLGFAGYLVAGQASALAKQLPEYRSNAAAKLEAVRGPFAKTLKRFQDTIKNAESVATPAPPGKETPPDGQEPVKVEVVGTAPSPIEIAAVIGAALLSAAGSVALVALLVVFFLIYRSEIRDRMIRLAGDAQVTITTQTMTDATHGISRFLFLQAILNATYGTVFGLILFAFGVPGALLWGVLAAVLRFVPYVGPVIAAALPILLSLGVFPGWNKPLLIAGIILVLEIIENNIVETVVYGRRAGLSPLAVVLAAAFWTWMWGGIGLILSVPLTLCLVSVGKHVPSLNFLAVALGDEPALDPKVQIFHRLLGRLQGQASELLEKEMTDRKSFPKFCDEVVLPVIRMIETDIQQEKLDEEKATYAFAALRQIVDDIAESVRSDPERKAYAGAESGAAAKAATVLCIPAGSPGDELSAHLLAQVLTLDGFRGLALRIEELNAESIAAQAGSVDLLVICISPPSNLLRVRNLYQRLRRRFGEIPVVQGLWGSGDMKAINGRLAPDGKAILVSAFVDAEKAVCELAKGTNGRGEVELFRGSKPGKRGHR